MSQVENGLDPPSIELVQYYISQLSGDRDKLLALYNAVIQERQELQQARRLSRRGIKPEELISDEAQPEPPRDWRRHRRLLIVLVLAVIVIGAMIGGVFASRKSPATSRFVCYKQVRGYQGDIWISIRPMEKSNGSLHATLRWGAKVNRQQLNGPTSLVTGKSADDSPLYVDVQPPATVDCGFGPHPDQAVRDIKPDWRRISELVI